MKTRFVLLAVCACAILLSWKPTATHCTKGTIGEASLTFAEPPQPKEPLHIKVWAFFYEGIESGKLILKINQTDVGPLPDVVLWTGALGRRDTVFATYALDPLGPGDYYIAAYLMPDPERELNREHLQEREVILDYLQVHVYVTVREHKVYTGRSDWIDNYRKEIMDELNARGLEGISRKDMQDKAPDLAERLRNLRSTTSIAPVDVVSMPPAQRPTLDSSKGIIFRGFKEGEHLQGTGDSVKYNPPKHPPTRTGRQPAYPYDKPSIDPPRERPIPPVRPVKGTTGVPVTPRLDPSDFVREPVIEHEAKADSADTSGSPP